LSERSTLEQRLRRVLLRLLGFVAGRRQGLPKLKPSELRRVLLVRYDRLGDMVITTPLLSALKQIAPQAEIDILASEANASLVRDDPRVGRIFVWGGSLRQRLEVIHQCRRQRYDAVFQLILARTTLPSILSGLLAPHGRVIGKSAPYHELLMNHSAALGDEHFSERTLSLLPVGVDLDGISLPEFPYSLTITDEERDRAGKRLAEAGLHPHEFILLNISAGSTQRELSDRQNVMLASRLAALGHDVLISASPDACERADRIAKQAGSRVASLQFASLREAIAAMGESLLVVTPDTGVVHMAAAVGAPIVAMFSCTGHPTGWSPRGVSFRVVQASHGETLREIEIEEVVAAAGELLERTTRGERKRPT
jgi:ADP-heptose:LPS heptosyltransferase